MNDRSEKLRNLLVPVLLVVLGLVLGAVLIAAFGLQSIQGYSSMLDAIFGLQRGIGETLRQATPLIFTALEFSVANSAGLFNIGFSGQAPCGWIVSVWVASALPDLPKVVLLPLYAILGALAGVMTVAVSGLPRAFLGTSEVIVTIMMSYILLYVSTFTLHEMMPESYRSSLDSSNMISRNASLRLFWLTQAFDGSRVNSGSFLAIITLAFVWLLMKKTTLGLEIRSAGLNPFASECAGMSSKRTTVLSMVISGALAGLGGVVEGLGTYQNFFVQTTSLSIGSGGMVVSLLGSGSATGILLSTALFSILETSGLGMQTGAGASSEIVNVSIALIIFFVGVNFLTRLVMAKFFQGEKQEEIVATIEAKPTNQNHEGDEL